MWPYLCLFLVLFGGALSAQSGIQNLMDARSFSMGGTASLDQGVAALFTNPAGLSTAQEFAAIATAQNQFLLPELQSAGLAALIPTKTGNFGLKAAAFGSQAYRENQFSLAYGRQLSRQFRLGAELIYWNNSIPEYGTRGYLTFALGIQSQLSEEFSVAAYIYNPIRTERNAEELTHSIMQLGLSYQPSEKLNLVAEVEKDVDHPANFRAGVDYSINDLIGLRLGLGTGPSIFSFGFSIQILPQIRVDIATSRHEILGFSPAFSLIYTNTP